MAIYHLSVKTVSRSAGRSATAAAAYRAGELIADTRTGEVHDYRRKGGVDRDHSPGIVLPAGAPEWARDRAQLWNAVEHAEKRKNSTVAREFEIALPAELSPSDRRALVETFAREVADLHGVAVDAQIHEPGREGDSRNWHVHVLTSTRRLTADGFGEKARELDDKTTGPQLVTRWRERWAELANAALARAGRSERIDHRSLAAQAIDREPTQHLGPKATAMEREGVPTRIGDENRAVVIDAAERFRVAREQAAIEREIAQVEAQLVDLAAEREKRAAAKRDRERIAGMSSAELTAEIKRLTPPRPSDVLTYSAPHLRAQADYQSAMVEETKARNATNDGQVKLRKWRERNAMRAWVHEQGLWRDERVSGLEQWLAKRPEVERQRAEAVAAAQAEARRVEYQELARIEAEQRPVRERIRELERFRDERIIQEKAQARQEAMVGQALRAFTAAATKRRTQAHGWGDGGREWEAVRPTMRGIITAYNAADDAARSRALESLEQQFRRNPEAAAEFAALARGRDHGRDMGMER